MKVKLTPEIIRNAEPRSKIYEIRDAVMTGLVLRVNANSGRKSFDLRHTEHGKQIRFPIGAADRMTLAQAREIAGARRIAIQLGWIPENDPQK